MWYFVHTMDGSGVLSAGLVGRGVSNSVRGKEATEESFVFAHAREATGGSADS